MAVMSLCQQETTEPPQQTQQLDSECGKLLLADSSSCPHCKCRLAFPPHT